MVQLSDIAAWATNKGLGLRLAFRDYRQPRMGVP